MFEDRLSELAELHAAWESDRSVFLTVLGRRRVGKTQLLTHFLQDRPHVYLTGTQQTASNQLVDASREVYRATGDSLLAHQDFTSWDAPLALVTRQAQDTRFGFVLDEFSYFAQAIPELESVIQRWWDRDGQRTRVFFVVADSNLAFMRRLLKGDQPLFGRRTHQLALAPFDYADAARFFPTYSFQDRLRAYGVFGGMPAYLSLWDGSASLAANLSKIVFSLGAALRREPDYLLAQERTIKEPAGYRSVLRAIAAGKTQPNEIAKAAGFRSPSDIAVILQRLRELGLVERIEPITAAPGGRISRYVVADPFLAFWFRFVQPAEAMLERGLGQLLVDDLFRDAGLLIDEFVSRPQGPWERACMGYLWRALRYGSLPGLRFDRLGCWWEGRGADESGEIDILGVRGRRVTVAGSCKWRRMSMKPADLQQLRKLAESIGAGQETRYVLFSRSGFDRNLVDLAARQGVILVTPRQMFEPPAVGLQTLAARTASPTADC